MLRMTLAAAAAAALFAFAAPPPAQARMANPALGTEVPSNVEPVKFRIAGTCAPACGAAGEAVMEGRTVAVGAAVPGAGLGAADCEPPPHPAIAPIATTSVKHSLFMRAP